MSRVYVGDHLYERGTTSWADHDVLVVDRVQYLYRDDDNTGWISYPNAWYDDGDWDEERMEEPDMNMPLESDVFDAWMALFPERN